MALGPLTVVNHAQRKEVFKRESKKPSVALSLLSDTVTWEENQAFVHTQNKIKKAAQQATFGTSLQQDT